MTDDYATFAMVVDCNECRPKTGHSVNDTQNQRNDPLSRPCYVCGAAIDKFCTKVKVDGTVTNERRPHHPERINPEASERKKKNIEASRNGVARVKALGTGGSWKSGRTTQ